MRQIIIKLVIALLIASLYALAWYTDIVTYLNFDTLHQSGTLLTELVALNYIGAASIFCIGYALVVLLAIPGNFILTMLGGFLFGPVMATLFVVGAATLGSVACVLWVRYLVGATLQKKYHAQLHDFNGHLNRYGTSYLCAARLFPFVPLVLINILVGLTKVPLTTFAWTTALGIIPVVGVYAFLGRHIMEISQLSDVVTPAFLGAGVLLTLLSLSPLLFRYTKR